jgi:isopentenyl diphosphate isomerase/L-lactate dehydrogenase-like FMN-dependent dehydrogenase
MLGWSKIRLLTSNLVDVSKANLKTSILGYQFNAPFFIAPAAQAGLANGGAESNLAKAAGAAGILYVPSISASQSIETIGAAKANGQIMFHQVSLQVAGSVVGRSIYSLDDIQEYCWNDKSRLQSELDRMKAAGFKAVFLTVDNNGINGIRSRQIRFYGRGGDAGHSDTFTVESLQAVQAMTTLPIIPKGVTDVGMIKKLADLGFPAVYISNHGGRMVDNTPTAVEILLDLHRLHPEVFSKIEIYVDGGVRRATHVLILLALGARAVGLGRPAMFANIYGQQGVAQILDQLKQEILTTMANIGQADINGIRGNTSFVSRECYGLMVSPTRFLT